jgi:hypothetical protein
MKAAPSSFTRVGALSAASLLRIIGSLSHRGTSACHTVSNCHGMDAVPGSCTQGGDREPAGAVFPPALIEMMKLVLDDVTALLPEAKRTSTMKVEIASKILACAAGGERDRIAMKAAALLIVV